jgi:hypothetical protein
MITSEYVGRAMTGVYRLGLQDAKGLSWFEMTADGFFRSFWAIGLSAPLYLYSVMGTMRAAQAMPDLDGKPISLSIFILLHALFFLGSCFGFLIAMIPLSRMLDLQGRYAGFAIAHNWGTLAYHVAAIVPVLAFALGVVNAADAIYLWLIAVGLTCYLRFAIISQTMNAPWPIAAALALTDLLIQTVWYLTLRSVLT